MSSTVTRAVLGVVSSLLLVASVALPQGPGSSGIHLDVLADWTSTHSAIADAPWAPGNGFVGYPTGTAGNPYEAYASPGTTMTIRLTVPPGTLGPAPFGSGSLVTIFYSIATPFIPLPPLAVVLSASMPGQPILLAVAPPAWGTLVDGIGMLAAPPPVPTSDPGHPYKLELEVQAPPAGIAGPIQLQAVIVTPTGMIGVSNGVAVSPGPSPFENSLLPAMTPIPPFGPLDEGFAVIPNPTGFSFYGVLQPQAQVITNPFIEFAPFGVGPGAPDFVGTPGDLGCPPLTATVSPRVAVNHYDADFAIPIPVPRVTDITLEIAPPVGNLPTRHIVRWKWGAPFGAPAYAPPLVPDTDYASAVVELWGDDGQTQAVTVPTDPTGAVVVDARSRVVVVRQDIHVVNTLFHHNMVGIGPGLQPVPPPCTPLPFWTLYGLAPYVTAPFEAVWMDPGTMGPLYGMDSSIQMNLALVFDPLLVAPVPGQYVVQDY